MSCGSGRERLDIMHGRDWAARKVKRTAGFDEVCRARTDARKYVIVPFSPSRLARPGNGLPSDTREASMIRESSHSRESDSPTPRPAMREKPQGMPIRLGKSERLMLGGGAGGQ
jgi:hypothetical protein